MSTIIGLVSTFRLPLQVAASFDHLVGFLAEKTSMWGEKDIRNR